MPVEVVWRQQALTDLMDIYLAIGMDSEAAAERWYAEIGHRVAMLSSFPRMGVRRPDIAIFARVLVCGTYLVLYEHRPNSDTGRIKLVEIVRVVNGRRDVARIFSKVPVE